MNQGLGYLTTLCTYTLYWFPAMVRFPDVKDETGPEFVADVDSKEGEGSDKLDIETPILAYYNVCVRKGIQPKIFKVSRTVIIAKPKRPDYTKPKAYRPIVLLNCLGKLMEKILSRRMQFEAQKYGLMHPCQFGGMMQHSTTDAGI